MLIGRVDPSQSLAVVDGTTQRVRVILMDEPGTPDTERGLNRDSPPEMDNGTAEFGTSVDLGKPNGIVSSRGIGGSLPTSFLAKAPTTASVPPSQSPPIRTIKAFSLTQSPPVGKISVSMRARRLFNVNTVDETFGVLLHFIFMWELPPWETPPKDDRYHHGERPDWVPRYRIKQVMDVAFTECSYRFLRSPNPLSAPHLVLMEEYHQVTLFEPMDLTVFPADCQGLTVVSPNP